MMKYIYLNLKRFDIPSSLGGVNRLAESPEWGPFIIRSITEPLAAMGDSMSFTVFFPEAHIIGAASAASPRQIPRIGCQSVFFEDTGSGNIGAFTSSRTANAAKALGCVDTIIGHCEERRALQNIMNAGDGNNVGVVNDILNKEIACAAKAGLRILYCVGERAEEQAAWETVLGEQLRRGLANIDTEGICIAYEPVWAIGPGKIPPDSAYIRKIAAFIKKETGGLPVVYGGGLKKENAPDIAGIHELDGGLIALTRFSGEIGFYPDEYIEIIKTYKRALN
jgi:triosephosphate isomerase